MQELAAATADKRMSQVFLGELYMWRLAQIQLALDKKSATIDTLRKLVALRTHAGQPVYCASSLLQIHPACDQIRADPHCQALLPATSPEAPGDGGEGSRH